MARLRYKKMTYFGFLTLTESQRTGHLDLTLKHDKSKIVTKGYWENGVIVGGFKDYMAWDYLISESSHVCKIQNLIDDIYKANPLSQIGFYGKEESLEGEFIDFYYKE